MTQQKQDWIRSNERAMWYFGGVPAAIVPDNLKSGVTLSSRYEPGINDLLDDFAGYYRTVILPARAGAPRDKALAENGVKLVYQRIYAPLRNEIFHSVEEINEAILPLLGRHNDKPFTRLGVSRRELFEEIEKSELKDLPVERYPLKYFKKQRHSGFNVHISEAIRAGDKEALTRVARYMMRSPVVISRLIYHREAQ
ncbi:MAG: transposase [Candidatus Krumholzibacteriota bacterium]|nr:transposase [Candidatus Krumholzibacteriota bacterium]